MNNTTNNSGGLLKKARSTNDERALFCINALKNVKGINKLIPYIKAGFFEINSFMHPSGDIYYSLVPMSDLYYILAHKLNYVFIIDVNHRYVRFIAEETNGIYRPRIPYDGNLCYYIDNIISLINRYVKEYTTSEQYASRFPELVTVQNNFINNKRKKRLDNIIKYSLMYYFMR